MSRPDASSRASFRETLAWTVGLVVLWVGIYCGCNWLSSLRTDVHVLQFGWERAIPFIPWLIIPYMSIDLFFLGAPFLTRSRHELHVLIARLLAATLIAAFFFLAIPMTLAVERPTTDGWLGSIYEILKAGDMPHNMCPSLHIALLLLLWPIYHRATRGLLRAAIHAWFALIFFSVVPVYQHHAVDVIGGALVAAVCIAAFPRTEHDLWLHRSELPQRRRVARRYALAGLPLMLLGIAIGPWGVIPGWIGGSLLLVAAYYALGSAALFRKHAGRLSPATRIILAPYLLGLRATRRVSASRGGAAWSHASDRVLVGRRPTRREAAQLVAEGVVAVVDMTAEHDTRDAFATAAYLNLPVLDLVAPSARACLEAAEFIAQHSARGTVYLHCGMGRTRCATVAAAYLLYTREAATAAEACALIAERHPAALLGSAELATVQAVEAILHTHSPPPSPPRPLIPQRCA